MKLAQVLYVRMMKSGVWANLVTYTGFVSGFVKEKKMVEAERILDDVENSPPSVV